MKRQLTIKLSEDDAWIVDAIEGLASEGRRSKTQQAIILLEAGLAAAGKEKPEPTDNPVG